MSTDRTEILQDIVDMGDIQWKELGFTDIKTTSEYRLQAADFHGHVTGKCPICGQEAEHKIYITENAVLVRGETWAANLAGSKFLNGGNAHLRTHQEDAGEQPA